jgi:DUF971 family protein
MLRHSETPCLYAKTLDATVSRSGCPTKHIRAEGNAQIVLRNDRLRVAIVYIKLGSNSSLRRSWIANGHTIVVRKSLDVGASNRQPIA